MKVAVSVTLPPEAHAAQNRARTIVTAGKTRSDSSEGKRRLIGCIKCIINDDISLVIIWQVQKILSDVH